VKRLLGFSPLVRYQIAERSNEWCERCGGIALDGQAHHRRPRAMGGSRNPETNQSANALWLCQPCHEHVESNRAEALKFGHLVPQSRIPAEVPVLRRGFWVLLDNRGDYLPIPEPAGGKVA
jgi:5-methylcytosine-specific restriction protein A